MSDPERSVPGTERTRARPSRLLNQTLGTIPVARSAFLAGILAALVTTVWPEGLARAEEHSDSFPLPRASKVHLALGPTVAGIHQEEGWDSQVGGELHLVRLRPSTLHATGLALGALTFSSSKTVRLHLDGYIGIRVSSDLTLGASLGPIVDVNPNQRARFGARASLWGHAGIAPYVSIARTWGATSPEQTEVGLGIRIPFSITDF